MLIFRTFSALSEYFVYPGATRSAALHACPWLSYCAPLALSPGYHIARLWRLSPGCHIARLWRSALAIILRALALSPGCHIARLWRWLSYCAPLALSSDFRADSSRCPRGSGAFAQSHLENEGSLLFTQLQVLSLRRTGWTHRNPTIVKIHCLALNRCENAIKNSPRHSDSSQPAHEQLDLLQNEVRTSNRRRVDCHRRLVSQLLQVYKNFFFTISSYFVKHLPDAREMNVA